MQLVLSRVFPAVYGQPRRFVHITTYQLKRLLILPGCIIRSLSSGIFRRKCKVSGEHKFKTQGIVSSICYYNWMLILIPFYPYIFFHPCSLGLLSSLTDSDMTPCISIIPLNLSRTFIFVQIKRMIIGGFFRRWTIFWMNIFNLSDSYLRSCR